MSEITEETLTEWEQAAGEGDLENFRPVIRVLLVEVRRLRHEKAELGRLVVALVRDTPCTDEQQSLLHALIGIPEVGEPEPLARVMFSREGQVAAFDREGRQVAHQQQPAPYRVLAEMAYEGALGDDTVVELWGEPAMSWVRLRERRAAELRRWPEEMLT